MLPRLSSPIARRFTLGVLTLSGLTLALNAQELGCHLGHIKERVPAHYPLSLRGNLVQGTVSVLATFSAQGRVTSSKAISGPDSLRFESQAYVNGWRADPSETQQQCVISLTYIADGSQGVCSDKHRPTVQPERVDDTHVTMRLNCDLW